MKKKLIRVAHSPDSDDAFMFYALARGKIETGDFEFVNELHDIETLNQAACVGTYEVSAVSIHAYAYLHEKYSLLNCGASMGEGYGPIVVSRKPVGHAELREIVVAVPGLRTSALLALRLLEPSARYHVVPFDQIIPAVEAGDYQAGLIIHEGQLTFKQHNLHKVVDLGEWWMQTTGLPLPLGGNVIRRDLGDETIAQVSRILRESIEYSLANREPALDYAQEFGRGLSTDQADQFVGMYVNRRTVDYGPDGRRAVQLFLDRGFEAGIIPSRVAVEFL